MNVEHNTAMGDQNVKDGTLDLERELSCSICTEVFFQPLTLLDCLHTFCGSCLKEWFSFQASSATSEHPYTCPSCRSRVRDTKPNATVTTLLEMFLKAHPDRGKTQEDKDGMGRTYTPGENVIPPVHISLDEEDSEEERLLASARELSLRDMDPRTSTRRLHAGAGTSHGRHRRRHHEESERGTYISYRRSTSSPRPTEDRQLDHQASLRSLVSASEPLSVEFQEEIMREIMDEGLDDIDLNNLTPSQEEDITERIARAVRSRHADHERRRHRHRSSATSSTFTTASPVSTVNHRYPTSSSATLTTPPHPSNPPLSRPHLLDEAAQYPQRHRRRTSGQASRTSPAARSDEALATPHLFQPASRSATDLSHHPRDNQAAIPRPSSTSNRRTTDPDNGVNLMPGSGRAASVVPGRHSARREASLPAQPRHALDAVPLNAATRVWNHRLHMSSDLRPANNSSPTLVPSSAGQVLVDRESGPATSAVAVEIEPAAAVTELPPIPSVACFRCEKPDIQTSLHYHCSICSLGRLDLCMDCYRAGKGCQHWFGFGHVAWERYQKLVSLGRSPPEHEKPHVLTARRYRQSDGVLEEGLFCEGCFAFADECYWHCDFCNEGAWGSCNNCVQQARHCTHPLQCIGRTSLLAAHPSSVSANSQSARDRAYNPAPFGNAQTAMSEATLPFVPDASLYTTLTLTVSCDICHRSVPPSDARFHCHTCNNGNYDICASCYHRLGSSGKVRPQDGVQGWRRCPQGHRMSIVGFEDREGGQKRVVVRDFVGGWALKEDGIANSQPVPASNGQWQWKEEDGTSASQTSKLRHATMTMMPPDGGVGLRTQALWSHFPQEGVKDELAFPRNSIITEVENINGDWFWGVYAGRKGLFPGNFVRVL